MNLTMPYRLGDYKHPIARTSLQILNASRAWVAQIVHTGEKAPEEDPFPLDNTTYGVILNIAPQNRGYCGINFQQFIPRMPTAPPRCKVLKKWPVGGFYTGDEASVVNSSRIGRASPRKLSPLM
jgi:hypothetical protein